MTLAPPRQPSSDELEALIREARVRQRRRWLVGAVVVATAAGAGLVAYSVLVGGSVGTKQGQSGRLAIGSSSRCRSDQLRVTKPIFDGAYTAHVVENVAFTNVSSRSCVLRGWPTFDVILPSGRRVAAHVGRVRNANSRGALPVRPVVIRSGSAASFHVIANDGTGLEQLCGIGLPETRVRVVPPASRTPAGGAVKMPYCHNPRRLLVLLSPVVAGRLDRYSFQ